MNATDFLIIIGLITFMVVSIGIHQDIGYISDKVYEIQAFLNNPDRSSMFNLTNERNTKTNGVYFTPDYYCIWTKGRNESEINRTDNHELCHHLVYMDRKEFCGETK